MSIRLHREGGNYVLMDSDISMHTFSEGELVCVLHAVMEAYFENIPVYSDVPISRFRDQIRSRALSEQDDTEGVPELDRSDRSELSVGESDSLVWHNPPEAGSEIRISTTPTFNEDFTPYYSIVDDPDSESGEGNGGIGLQEVYDSINADNRPDFSDWAAGARRLIASAELTEMFAGTESVRSDQPSSIERDLSGRPINRPEGD